ncbi:MAG: hypothetical protein CMF62_01375 [Magnetococcales bacterium]|nr:hypothetical protein [Magnetococcales bacterium]|tara:strand:- start:56 stop:826 length:771 start_codon:yes stop_codon:yes gene_type:complete
MQFVSVLGDTNQTEDFTQDDFIIEKKKKPKSAYKLNGRIIKYDNRTMVWYRGLRKQKIDPIICDEVSEDIAFKFKDRWDPYTGERIEEDPYGSLYFNPVHLLYYYYSNRLNKLWSYSEGEYQGYYDDGVGAGENFNVKGRGDYPEWYLFRLPIPDCYLTKSHNNNVVTMGPKLSKDELEQIDSLMKLPKLISQYKNFYKKNPPSILHMKKYYDLAISNNVQIDEEKEFLTDEEKLLSDAELKNKINRNAVIKLSKL